ncbi:hypothetical protein AVEN_197602-1 [Araneus ventricosus]|uniref:Uncharacterized protein n=1 Tax=Araneus ventricosus TaxID=182803 RepID=A0A4Y2Q9A0_ARAVE|nr:hypothetical protein AVEN_197602-1 [Araneus ventricosus]
MLNRSGIRAILKGEGTVYQMGDRISPMGGMTRGGRNDDLLKFRQISLYLLSEYPLRELGTQIFPKGTQHPRQGPSPGLPTGATPGIEYENIMRLHGKFERTFVLRIIHYSNPLRSMPPQWRHSQIVLEVCLFCFRPTPIRPPVWVGCSVWV